LRSNVKGHGPVFRDKQKKGKRGSEKKHRKNERRGGMFSGLLAMVSKSNQIKSEVNARAGDRETEGGFRKTQVSIKCQRWGNAGE